MTASGYFFHDLQCRSGLGDRLLDLWAAATIARLHDPGRVLAVQWHPGYQFSSFRGEYSTAAFSLPAAPSSRRRRRAPSRFPDHVQSCRDERSGPAAGQRRGLGQIVLRAGMVWGNSSPERVHADLAFYSLDPSITLERVIATYREVALATTAALPVWEAGEPDGIDACLGVHVRLGDKLVSNETAVDMSEPTWRDLEQKALAYLDGCIAEQRPLFACSDDTRYLAALIEHLRRGRRGRHRPIVQAPASLAGARSLVDFFALSRCRPIVQMTKYSTFSLAAALAGSTPLVNSSQTERVGLTGSTSGEARSPPHRSRPRQPLVAALDEIAVVHVQVPRVRPTRVLGHEEPARPISREKPGQTVVEVLVERHVHRQVPVAAPQLADVVVDHEVKGASVERDGVRGMTLPEAEQVRGDAFHGLRLDHRAELKDAPVHAGQLLQASRCVRLEHCHRT